jgi:hypothetical protein
MLACARRRIERNAIEHTAIAIERIRAPMNSKVACPILEIGLGFCFTISRVSRCFYDSLDSINRHVNTEIYTRDFGEELTAFQGSVFWVYSFPFYFIYEDV